MILVIFLTKFYLFKFLDRLKQHLNTPLRFLDSCLNTLGQLFKFLSLSKIDIDIYKNNVDLKIDIATAHLFRYLKKDRDTPQLDLLLNLRIKFKHQEGSRECYSCKTRFRRRWYRISYGLSSCRNNTNSRYNFNRNKVL